MSALPSPVATGRRSRGVKALKIALFCVALVLGVLAALAILFRFAGTWGVPYVPFTTERGSHCVNTFSGFRCPSLTLADVNYFGGLELPAATRVLSADYHATHDYQLNATLEVPPAASKSARVALTDAFGRCDKKHPSPLNGQGLSAVCVMANDTDITESGVPDSRVYVVATGIGKDKTRMISLAVRSR